MLSYRLPLLVRQVAAKACMLESDGWRFAFPSRLLAVAYDLDAPSAAGPGQRYGFRSTDRTVKAAMLAGFVGKMEVHLYAPRLSRQ
jgi:hypothetical protein